MNKIIQIIGLILNIYLVFLLISKNNKIKINQPKIIASAMTYLTFSWLQHTSQDTNRLKILNRIGILQLICYSLFEIDTIRSLGSFELTIKDGIYKITTLKSKIILFIICVAIIILMVINNYNDAVNNPTPSEQYLILLTNILGITSLILSNDWVLTIISWELFNFSLYQLINMNGSSESALSSSLKYFILSALSTGVLLLGISIIYILTGSTNYDNIASILNQCINNNEVGQDTQNYAICQILFTLLFKLSAAPFYQWAPERGCGESSIIGNKLSNSGNTLELKIPSHIRKGVSGWSNYPCMVTSLKASEKNVGNRGSKSDELQLNVLSVKEQRVYGSWNDNFLSFLRCILMEHESVNQVKIPSNQIIQRQNFSVSLDSLTTLFIYPWYLTSLIDA